MAILEYQDIVFEDEKGQLNVRFSNLFAFTIPGSELSRIDMNFQVCNHKIIFPKAKQGIAERKFSYLLQKHIPSMKNTLGGKDAYYIHRNSGIPLIGTNYFGLVDRGTNIIEVKPMTGCNLNCIYCSVDEGTRSRKKTDYLVEADYLIEEFKKLVHLKGIEGIEAHIGGQTDPSLYSQLPRLVSGLAAIPQVHVVSIDTNGWVLGENKIKELSEAGLTRINLSLNAITPEIAKNISGTSFYSVERVLRRIPCILQRMDLVVAPVWIPGINDAEIPRIIEEILTLDPERKAVIGIQNFLDYKHGRNPSKPMDYSLFYEKLNALEKKFKVSLIRDKGDFHIQRAKQYEKPFVKGEVVGASYILPGRLRNEALFHANGRIIAVNPWNGKKKGVLRILRDKHNIFSGVLL